MQRKNDEKKLDKIFDSNELEIVMANLRAWNHWGRIWRLERKKSSLDPHTLRIMKTRALTYRKVYLKMTLSLGGFEGKSILDIGCGTSEYHKWLANDCNMLVGVDISVEMLKLCREDMGKSIGLIAADALHLPFREGAFDASLTFQALHHFPDWKKALTEMVRTAKQVILYEPNGDSVFHRLMHLIRLTFRIEQRFKQTDEDYELVEFQAGGFSPARVIHFLERKGMNTKLFMLGIIPVSLLEKVSNLSSQLMFFVLGVEDMVGKMPILRNQLGSMLVIGWKTKYRMKIHHAKSKYEEA